VVPTTALLISGSLTTASNALNLQTDCAHKINPTAPTTAPCPSPLLSLSHLQTDCARPDQDIATPRGESTPKLSQKQIERVPKGRIHGNKRAISRILPRTTNTNAALPALTSGGNLKVGHKGRRSRLQCTAMMLQCMLQC
jgi:hypothetical protein